MRKICRNYVIGVMTIAFDVSWVELDLRQKHKTWLVYKRAGPVWSDHLTNGAMWRKLADGKGFFDNRVLRG